MLASLSRQGVRKGAQISIFSRSLSRSLSIRKPVILRLALYRNPEMIAPHRKNTKKLLHLEDFFRLDSLARKFRDFPSTHPAPKRSSFFLSSSPLFPNSSLLVAVSSPLFRSFSPNAHFFPLSFSRSFFSSFSQKTDAKGEATLSERVPRVSNRRPDPSWHHGSSGCQTDRYILIRHF